MNSRQGATAALILFVASVFSVVVGAGGPQTDLVANQYYVTSLGQPAIPLVTLTQRAQSSGYTTILRHGNEVVSFYGTERTDQAEEVLLGTGCLLYVDGEFILLRVIGPDYDYVVRPGATGYELLLIPHRDLALGEPLLSSLTELQRLGIVGESLNLAFTAFPKSPEKTPPAPQGVRLDSLLYGLVLSEDWFSYVTKNGLTRTGLRVEVVAEKVPGGTIPESYRPYLTEETAQLAKLLVPIHLLVDLARSASVNYVRPPYQPVPAV